MKHSYPMNSAVRWHPDERVIGVVGVAPWATLDFYEKVLRQTTAAKDWQHVRVVLDSNPKIPSRGRHLELDETDPTPYLRESIEALHGFGADLIVVPCNTAHYFYDGFTAGVEVPVIHMIGATVAEVVESAPKARRVGILGSRTTVGKRLYEPFLAASERSSVYLEHRQSEVSAIIERVKVGDTGGETTSQFEALVAEMADHGADVVVLGCTELSLLDGVRSSLPLVDSNAALASAALAAALNPETAVPTRQAET